MSAALHVQRDGTPLCGMGRAGDRVAMALDPARATCGACLTALADGVTEASAIDRALEVLDRSPTSLRLLARAAFIVEATLVVTEDERRAGELGGYWPPGLALLEVSDLAARGLLALVQANIFLTPAASAWLARLARAEAG